MPSAYQWTPEQLQDILSSYSNGESAVSIAQRYNISYQIIRPLLQKHGIAVRSRAEVRRTCICNYSYFHTIDTEEKAYWLGFLTADGCITTGNRVTVNLASVDVAHLHKLKVALSASQMISANKRGDYTLVICSSEMALDLALHGVHPNKTFFTKPAQLAPELMRHYWRGILDGDGYISKDATSITLVGDYGIVLAFQAFVLSHCLYVKANIHRKENIFSFTIRQEATKCILAQIYTDASVYLDRKYERAQQLLV